MSWRQGAVAIVEDEADMRVMLGDILVRSGVFFCAGSYASAYEALEAIPAIRPQLVFMDICLPGMSGIECVSRLKAQLPALKIIMVTGVTDPVSIAEASRAGTDGYLTKPFTPDQLLASIRFALLGSSRLPLEAKSEASARPVPVWRGSRLLTVRENELMMLLAKGYLYKEIETQMRLSGSVVKKVQHKIFLKLGVSNRTEAVSRWQTERERQAEAQDVPCRTVF